MTLQVHKTDSSGSDMDPDQQGSGTYCMIRNWALTLTKIILKNEPFDDFDS
jgi:hypothetical protein